MLQSSILQAYEYNKLISDFAYFQNPHVVLQINQIFFNIGGQHEDFDIKHNIVRQNLSIIIQNVTKYDLLGVNRHVNNFEY